MKKYIKPRIEIITFEPDSTLLAASGVGVKTDSDLGNEYFEGVESLSIHNGGSSIWDDDE